jgi:ferric-dicitrate binding protein FerR (iron transport regulator)
MSKSSRRRKAMENRTKKMATDSSDPLPQPTFTPTSTQGAVSTFLGRARRRRTPWLVLAACLVALGGYLVTRFQESHRTGIIDYSSDDPQAEVVIEKDGQEIPLGKGTKFSVQVEPGSYNIRLVSPTEGLKLSPPKLINMDPGGRAFVTVRYVGKPQIP